MALPLVLTAAPILTSTASALTPDQQSEADIKNARLTWVDFGTIKGEIGSQTYFFKYSPRNSLREYTTKEHSCFASVFVDGDYFVNAGNPDAKGPSSVSLDMDYIHNDPEAVSDSKSKCRNVGEKDSRITRPIGSPENFSIHFYKSKDGTTISRWDNQTSWDFSQSTKYPNLYTRNSESDCQDTVKVSGNSYFIYELTPNFNNSTREKPPADIRADDGCFIAKEPTSGVQNGVAQKMGIPTNEAGPVATGGGSSGSTAAEDAESQLACDAGSNPLSWIMCPAIDAMVDIINEVDGIITDQLTIKTNNIFCENKGSCNAYYSAWQSFRNIALGLMAVVGLIILIAQALGMEILDAYVIRKTLPRLLIAAVGITLSWPIMNLFVQFTNDLGLGIRHLIYLPFAQLNGEIDLNFGSGASDGIFNFIFGAAGTGLAVIGIIGGIGALLLYAITGMLAVLVAIIVLVLRQVLITLLVILAPIAIIAYVLPNTLKIYKFWWESFSKALLMFPLIAAFIASGRVFSAIALESKGPVSQLIGFVAYFAPYFLIALTFRFAGGALSQLGGFVNDRSKGGFDRLRQGRANQMKQFGRDIHAGQATRLLGGAREGSYRDRVNKRLQKTAHIGAAGLRPGMWKENIAQSVAAGDVRGTSKELINDQAFAPIRGNDDLAEALSSNDFDIEEARKTLAKKFGEPKANQMISGYQVAARALRKKGYSERAIQTGTVMSGLTASTALTREEDYAGGKFIGSANLADTLERLSGGDANLQAQMVAAAMDATPDRPEIMPSFSEGFEVLQKITAASSLGPAARQAEVAASAKTLRRTAVRKKGINVLFGNGHTSRNMAKEYEDMVNETYQNHVRAQAGQPITIERLSKDTGKVERVQLSGAEAKAAAEDQWMQMVAEMVATQNNSGNLPLEKRPVIGNLIAHPLGPDVTVQSEATRLRTDEQFQKYVSDYGYLQRATAGAFDPSDPAARAAAEAARIAAEGSQTGPGNLPGR